MHPLASNNDSSDIVPAKKQAWIQNIYDQRPFPCDSCCVRWVLLCVLCKLQPSVHVANTSRQMATCTRWAHSCYWYASSYQSCLQTKIPTYHFQDSLPKLKIPKLEQSLDRVSATLLAYWRYVHFSLHSQFLKSATPLVSAAQLAKTTVLLSASSLVE